MEHMSAGIELFSAFIEWFSADMELMSALMDVFGLQIADLFVEARCLQLGFALQSTRCVNGGSEVIPERMSQYHHWPSFVASPDGIGR